jgi:hypothetical protein
VQNLWTVLVGDLIERAFEGSTSGGESTSCDIVLEQFFIDDVDDGGDEGLDVFCASDESFNVTYKRRVLVEFELGIKFALNCRLMSSYDKFALGVTYGLRSRGTSEDTEHGLRGSCRDPRDQCAS